MSQPRSPMTRVGVLGQGVIGAKVAQRLARGEIPGVELACVISRSTVADPPVPQVDIDDAIERCDLIIECAGQPALMTHGEAILDSGTDLLIASVGALMDQDFNRRLHNCSPGRLSWTSGALGGLDMLSAATRAGEFQSVSLTTTKKPETLVQPWMSTLQVDALQNAREPHIVFTGSAQEAARLFPQSLNVAAAISLAINDFELLTVSLVADPDASRVMHLVEASGPCGDYRFEMRNSASPANPRTSEVVPFAILESLDKLTQA